MLVLFIAPVFRAARAQSIGPELRLGEIDKSEFPEVSLDFSIKNARPNQLEPLKDSEITILEGSKKIPISRLESQYTGTHFMLAINTARNLALFDLHGISNYDKMKGVIKTLGSNLAPDSGDHFSLFINPESQWNELSSYSEWLNALDSYEDVYGMRRIDQSFASLEMAINAFQNSELDQETVLLYVAPAIYPRNVERFKELIAQATQLGLPIHTWMVLEFPDTSTAKEAELREALDAGGGSLFLFSRDEELPDPKSYIEGMGYRYTVAYESSLRASQTVKLSVQVDTLGLGKLQSASKELSVFVQPAQLRFLNLISELSVELDKEGLPNPKELPLEVSIEFPDNYPREILVTSLWVNGEKIKENQAPPYGNFLIELESYTESENLSLEVKLDDSWGLQGSTGTQKVALTVIEPENFIQEVSQGSTRWLLLGAGVGILILGFIFILSGSRKKRKTKNTTKETSASMAKTEELQEDSEMALAQAQSEPSNNDEVKLLEKPDEKVKEPEQASSATQQEMLIAPARHFGSLHKLDKDSTPSAVKPFLLTKKVIYIGRDPKLADLVLDDPAIEPLHAELQLFDDGRATLTDFKTTAGTYRNFKALSGTAIELQHGDILHFGTVMYRFHSVTRTSSPSATTEKEG